jgi:hypothetical protein
MADQENLSMWRRKDALVDAYVEEKETCRIVEVMASSPLAGLPVASRPIAAKNACSKILQRYEGQYGGVAKKFPPC